MSSQATLKWKLSDVSRYYRPRAPSWLKSMDRKEAVICMAKVGKAPVSPLLAVNRSLKPKVQKTEQKVYVRL